jgi:hypothetical protein
VLALSLHASIELMEWKLLVKYVNKIRSVLKALKKNLFKKKNLIFFFWMDGLDGKTYYYLTNRKIME